MIQIYRNINGAETRTIKVSDLNAIHKSEIMGMDEVQVSVVVDSVLDIQQGDYIKYNGIEYVLNRAAEYTKVSDVQFDYALVFEHPLYRLLDKLYMHQTTRATTFWLTGRLRDFVELLVWNVNKSTTNPLGVDTGWTVGNVEHTDFRNVFISDASCRDVLNILADEFDCEFFLDTSASLSDRGKRINFTDKVRRITDYTFEQGREKGLYTITHQNVDREDTVTRAFIRGGNRNVPNDYVDEEGFLKLPENFLENFEEHSTVVERKVRFDDEFPHFIGSVTTVSGTPRDFIITCPAINFNLREIAVGNNARINFLTGDLMGRSFEFIPNDARREIRLIQADDELAFPDAAGNKPPIPNELQRPRIGDQFNFTGVWMPKEYVDASIERLREKGKRWLEFHSRKRVKYDLEIDHRFLRGKKVLKVGDVVTIIVTEKNEKIIHRITSIDKNLRTGALTATVSNYLDEKWERRIEGAIAQIQASVVSGGGVGGSVDIEVLEELDNRQPSNRNVFSSLRVMREISNFWTKIKNKFLRKDIPDTASEIITFVKGLKIFNFRKGFLDGSGIGTYQDLAGNSTIETDNLVVRKNMIVNEFLISQIRFQGGIAVFSAAAMEVSEVIDGGSHFELRFDRKGGMLENHFVAGDQIRCQRVSGHNTPKPKIYMSVVTSVGENFIRIDQTYYTPLPMQHNVPEAGDIVVQWGHRTDAMRQSLIVFDTTGGGRQTFHQNVNSFDMANTNAVEMGLLQNHMKNDKWRAMMRAYGDLFVGNRGRNPRNFLSYDEETGQLTISGRVQFQSGGSQTDLESWAGSTNNSVRVAQESADEARDKIDNLRFGGVNLLHNSNDQDFSGLIGSVVINHGKVPVPEWGAVDANRVATSGGTSTIVAAFSAGAFKVGEIYTQSFWLRNNNPDRSIITSINGNRERVEIPPLGSIRYIGVGATLAVDSGLIMFQIRNTDNNIGQSTDFTWWRMQIEEGNIASAWSENPEDSQQRISALRNFTDTAFRDGVVGRAERAAIEAKLNGIAETKLSIDANFAQMNLNAHLIGTPRTNLANAHTALNTAHTNLVNNINAAIATDTVTVAQKAEVNNRFGLFNTALATYQVRLEEANRAIQNRLDQIARERVDNLQIGGRNLIHGGFENGRWNQASIGGFISGDFGRTRQVLDLIVGETYTFSMKPGTVVQSPGGVWITFRNADNTYHSVIIRTVSEFTFIAPASRCTISFNAEHYTTEHGGRVFGERLPKLERGNKATDWSPAPEDVEQRITQAQADATQARAITDGFTEIITDGFTEIDGGLVRTHIISLRDTVSSTETAGINGLQGANSNNPAFWAGGTFAQAKALIDYLNAPTAAQYANLAKIAMMHNGLAKVGNFLIGSNGRVSVVDPATGVERIAFDTAPVMDVNNLLAADTGRGEITVPRFFDSNVQPGFSGTSTVTVPNSNLVVSRDGSTLTLGASSFRVDAPPQLPLRVTLMLMRGNQPFVHITSHHQPGTPVSFPATTFQGVQSGTYSLAFLVESQGAAAGRSIEMNSVVFSWNFVRAGIRKVEFGLNGMLAFFANNHMSFTENGGLDVRGQTNMPGVLLSGTGGASGGASNLWGARRHASRNVELVSPGTYDIFHDIRHTEYAVLITPGTANRVATVGTKQTDRVRVQFHTNAGTPALSNSNFEFLLSGRNYP